MLALLLVVAGVQSRPDLCHDLAPMFAQLRSRERRLLTREGEPSRVLLPLIRARFAATRCIIHELERPSTRAHHDYARSLFIALGINKDPATRTWLMEQATRIPQYRQFVYGVWCFQWQSIGIGMYDTRRYLTYKWLGEDASAWFAWFKKLYGAARTSEERIACLRAMSTCFHSSEAVEFFREQEGQEQGEALLIVQEYLVRHRRTIDAQRLTETIRQLAHAKRGRQTLVISAFRMRHEAFVPALLTFLDNDDDLRASAIDALRAISLRPELATREEWMQWWEKNRQRTHAQWVNDAAARLMRIAHSKPSRCAKMLSDGYYLADPCLLSCVRKLTVLTELHPAIGRWVVKSYREADRSAFARIAETIIKSSWTKLDWYARRGLTELDFVEGKTRNWEDWWR